MNEKIEKIIKEYELLKAQDCHIYGDESHEEKRHKDMLFGKILAFERVIAILQN